MVASCKCDLHPFTVEIVPALTASSRRIASWRKKRIAHSPSHDTTSLLIVERLLPLHLRRRPSSGEMTQTREKKIRPARQLPPGAAGAIPLHLTWKKRGKNTKASRAWRGPCGCHSCRGKKGEQKSRASRAWCAPCGSHPCGGCHSCVEKKQGKDEGESGLVRSMRKPPLRLTPLLLAWRKKQGKDEGESGLVQLMRMPPLLPWEKKGKNRG